MRKIQFDIVNGIYEMESFDDNIDYIGCFFDHITYERFLIFFRESFDGIRGMEI